MNASVTAQGPSVLLHHLDNFRGQLRSGGYSSQTIRLYMARLRSLDRLAAAERIDLDTLVDRQLNGRPLVTASSGPVMRVEGFHAFVQFMARNKLLALHGLQAQIEHLLARFRKHLKENQGLSQSTMTQYGVIAERFLRHCFKDELRIQRLSAKEVLNFLAVQGNHRRHINTGVKMFLRFLFQVGLISKPLAEGLPAVRRMRKQRLPRFISPEQVELILMNFPTATPVQRRNRAVLLLLARLGLRLLEALALRLEDINWSAGDLLIRGKGGYLDRMALPADVAAAVSAYIENDRPETMSTSIFVDHKAPFEGLLHSRHIWNEIHATCQKLGIEMPARTGTRVFRHTFATQLVSEGKSITEVANLLRHRRLNTTMVYARTDLKRLREVAPPWPLLKRRAV